MRAHSDKIRPQLMQMCIMNGSISSACQNKDKLRSVLISLCLEAFSSLMLFFFLRLWIIYVGGWTKNSLWWISVTAPATVNWGTLGWILDLRVIGSTQGTHCNLGKYMAIVVIFWSYTLNPAQCEQNDNVCLRKNTFCAILFFFFKTNISGSRS